ncbi:hypothetical protein J6590_047662 [Homalodisca vitripennis]|nr:hypothetical protein J6590_047662 [Homalodisca vitripennis]
MWGLSCPKSFPNWTASAALVSAWLISGFDAMLSMELSPLHHAGTITMGGHHLDQLVLPQQAQHMHHALLQEEPKKKLTLGRKTVVMCKTFPDPTSAIVLKRSYGQPGKQVGEEKVYIPDRMFYDRGFGAIEFRARSRTRRSPRRADSGTDILWRFTLASCSDINELCMSHTLVKNLLVDSSSHPSDFPNRTLQTSEVSRTWPSESVPYGAGGSC